MLSHEFLKQTIEIVDRFSDDNRSTVSPNRAVLVKIEPETDDLTDKKTMVAPLQQKLELLKKAVDVSSYFDEGEPGYDPGPNDGEKTPDELKEIKRLAGVMHNAGDDNDVLDA